MSVDAEAGRLTPSEAAVLDHLVEAWNAFLALSGHHPDDLAEFRHAIHQAQNILARRAAARVDPTWWSPENERRWAGDVPGGGGRG